MSVSRLPPYSTSKKKKEKKKISGMTHLITFAPYPFSPEINPLWL